MERNHSVLPRARTSQLLSRELPDGVMVYDSERYHAHSLNATATLIWQHCDGKTTVPELARLLQARLSLPADEELVWLALHRLEEAHLLEESLAPAAEAAAITRRSIIRKLGLTGSLALLLPVVSSVTVPTPAHAQSGGSTTGITSTSGTTTGGTTTGSTTTGGTTTASTTTGSTTTGSTTTGSTTSGGTTSGGTTSGTGGECIALNSPCTPGVSTCCAPYTCKNKNGQMICC